MFSVHITQEEFEKAAITTDFIFAVEDNSVMAITLSSGVMSQFVKISIFKMLSVHTTTQIPSV